MPVSRTLDFIAALGVLGSVPATGATGATEDDGISRTDLYWAGRATLLARHEDVDIYDAEFARWLELLDRDGGDRDDAERMRMVQVLETGFDALDASDPGSTGDVQAESATGPEDATGDRPEVDRAVRYSATEVLRHRDFAELSTDELDELWPLVDRLRLDGARRRSARHVTSSRPGRLDLRTTARIAARRGGEIVELRHQRPDTRPRPVVLLIDISGSMEPYARAMLRFAHAASMGRRRVEVFALGTRLTRLTRELVGHDPERGLQRAAAVVADWSGGTRLGDGLRQFLDEWGQRGAARGATVVILSDGWDRGEPEVLGEQLGRLRRLAHRIVWANPLKATPGFAPLARGMATALPYCDSFVEGHSFASLESLVALLSISDAPERAPHGSPARELSLAPSRVPGG